MVQFIVHFLNQTHALSADADQISDLDIKELLSHKYNGKIPVELIQLLVNGVEIDDTIDTTELDLIDTDEQYLADKLLGLRLKESQDEQEPTLPLSPRKGATSKQDLDEVFIVRASIKSEGLCGGKGGFGAMLRAQAKQKGLKKTTDFGACRDLSGRRLRHVNDEVILDKWKAARADNKEFDTTQDTPSGIDLWFMGTPAWADGVKTKGDKKRRYMAGLVKTSLCIDWTKARESRSAPNGAPDHWGCPRGRRCEFAHGVHDLRGDALKAMEDSKNKEKQDEADSNKETYMGVLYRAAKPDDEVSQLVMAGLSASTASTASQRSGLSASTASTASQRSSQPSSSSSLSTSRPVETACPFIQSLEDGAVVVSKDGMVTGSSTFGTAIVADCSLGCLRNSSDTSDSSGSGSDGSGSGGNSNSSSSSDSGKSGSSVEGGTSTSTSSSSSSGSGSGRGFYYEVEILCDKLMQIGWVDKRLFSGRTASGDGVGDDAHSWAFDGFRSKLFHSGKSRTYGVTGNGSDSAISEDSDSDVESPHCWKKGHILGCYLHLSEPSHKRQDQDQDQDQDQAESGKGNVTVTATIGFSLNGQYLGTAFVFPVDADCEFSPALSLEEGDSCMLNIGQRKMSTSASMWINAPASPAASTTTTTKKTKTAKGKQEAVANGPTEVICSAVNDIIERPTPQDNTDYYTLALAMQRSNKNSSKNDHQKNEPSKNSSSEASLLSVSVSVPDVREKEKKRENKDAKPKAAAQASFPAVGLEDEQYALPAGRATLLELGLDHLKAELTRRGLKAGGTLEQRVDRLLAVRDIDPARIDKKLRAK